LYANVFGALHGFCSGTAQLRQQCNGTVSLHRVCAKASTGAAWSNAGQLFSPSVTSSAAICTVVFLQAGWDDNQMKYLLRELLIHQELSACR
jgi:hypothetical protein